MTRATVTGLWCNSSEENRKKFVELELEPVNRETNKEAFTNYHAKERLKLTQHDVRFTS